MNIRLVHCACAVLFITLLSACGFHLRGYGPSTTTLPSAMAITYIDAVNQATALVQQLKRALRNAEVELVSTQQASAATLTIRENTGRRTLSVGTDAKTAEYQVYYNVQFNLSDAEGQVLLSEQSITLTREYRFDRLAITAADQQERQLRLEMQRELARLIIDRLAALEATQTPAGSAP